MAARILTASATGQLPTQVEIAIQDPLGARIARDNGADRVELCSALSTTGGITPSGALISACTSQGIDVHVLIRCRPGGFVYSSEEVAIMCEEIKISRDCGAKGVVVGAATKDNQLDICALERFRNVCEDIGFTLHRVIDIAEDRILALKQIHELGFQRVLTSAGRPTAPEAATQLAEMCNSDSARAGLQIMAGGGVKPENVNQLRGLGLAAIHGSCSVPGPDTGPCGPGGGTQNPMVNDPGTVRELVRTVHGWAGINNDH